MNQQTLKLNDANTPASAGNTQITVDWTPIVKKHPRECGEYQYGNGCSLEEIETPPRVRGIPLFQNLEKLCLGNTPASAGNTYGKGTKQAPGWKHPRECGEYRKVRM